MSNDLEPKSLKDVETFLRRLTYPTFEIDEELYIANDENNAMELMAKKYSERKAYFEKNESSDTFFKSNFNQFYDDMIQSKIEAGHDVYALKYMLEERIGDEGFKESKPIHRLSVNFEMLTLEFSYYPRNQPTRTELFYKIACARNRWMAKLETAIENFEDSTRVLVKGGAFVFETEKRRGDHLRSKMKWHPVQSKLFHKDGFLIQTWLNESYERYVAFKIRYSNALSEIDFIKFNSALAELAENLPDLK